ncbi:hypothetical protein IQ07DRAFT_90122 [Pyrenochaeta sp. DS3sAY3a]|nr:hypothetical protein IQ07DRAFT_90122 [Pyrenochaeta sp. DS3sAY3a]
MALITSTSASTPFTTYPTPTPYDSGTYRNVDDAREKFTVIFYIALIVVILFMGPMLWLCISEKLKKRKRRHHQTSDLEGTTAASTKQKKTWTSPDPFIYGGSTLVASVKSTPKHDQRKHTRRRERPKTVTTEQILGIDKSSLLQAIPIRSG